MVCVLAKPGCCIDMCEYLDHSYCRRVATQVQYLDVLPGKLLVMCHQVKSMTGKARFKPASWSWNDVLAYIIIVSHKLFRHEKTSLFFGHQRDCGGDDGCMN